MRELGPFLRSSLDLAKEQSGLWWRKSITRVAQNRKLDNERRGGLLIEPESCLVARPAHLHFESERDEA